MKSMHAGVVFVAGLIVGLSAAGCGDRGTGPDNPAGTNPLIHEPWPDEEAELMAVFMSGEIGASRQLYERVQADLATIRDQWGDSIPKVREITFSPLTAVGCLIMGVDVDVYEDMKNGKYKAWDSLNAAYGMTMTPQSFDNRLSTYVSLCSPYRLNPNVLVRAYAGLPGIRWVETDGYGLDGSNVFGALHSFGRSYLVRYGSGDCYAGCISSHFWYFRSRNDGAVEYVGEWSIPSGEGNSEPEWWAEAQTNWDQYNQVELWQRQDSLPPEPISDLAVAGIGSNSVTLTWTAPFDAGSSGRVTGYRVRYFGSPITETNWDSTWVVQDAIVPVSPGGQQEMTATGLTSTTEYYFAIKARDYSGNWSALSNVVTATTLAASGWTNFDAANSGLVDNQVNAVAVDRDGVVWFGTDRGVSRFDGTNWTSYVAHEGSLVDNHVNAIAIDSSGDLWFATMRGVSRFDGATWTTYKTSNSGLAFDGVLSIGVDPDGDVWFATGGGGANRFDGSRWTTYDRTNSGLDYLYAVWSIAFADNSVVWIGSDRGAFRFDGVEWVQFNKSNSGLARDNVRALAVDRAGGVWFGLQNFSVPGVIRFDGNDWTDYLPRTRTRFLLSDQAGGIWLASFNGAYYFNGGSWRRFDRGNSGLISDDVWGIAVDHEGNVWFGTSKGVSRYQALVVPAAGLSSVRRDRSSWMGR